MLTDLLAALSDCAWAFDTHTQTYLFISPSVHAIFEYSAKDFQQNHNLWSEIIDPRDREEVLLSGKNETGEWSEISYRIVAKSGKTKWINHKKRLLTDESTGHTVVLNVVKDISDQRQINYKMQ